MVFGTIRFKEFQDEGANLHLFRRLFLGIGMYDREYSDLDTGKITVIKDPYPRPYLIAVQEFHYPPPAPWEHGLTDDLSSTVDDGTIPIETTVVSGGVNHETAHMYFYDDSCELKIKAVKEHGHDETPLLYYLEDIFPLGLNEFRQIFGKRRDMHIFGTSFGDVKSFDDDALSLNQLTMTLAPHGTIAELMESNLLLRSSEIDDNKSLYGSTFLDILERDVERLTSSLQESMEVSRSNLNQKHQDLLEQFGREHEEAKDNIPKFSS